MTVKQVTLKSKSRKPTAKAKANKLRQRVVKTMLTQAEGETFDSLLQVCRLSQAEFVRRACLRQTIKVVPDQNLTMYATLGTLQRSVQTVLKGELPESSREQLEAALESLKTTRLLLVDVDPTDTAEPTEETATEGV